MTFGREEKYAARTLSKVGHGVFTSGLKDEPYGTEEAAVVVGNHLSRARASGSDAVDTKRGELTRCTRKPPSTSSNAISNGFQAFCAIGAGEARARGIAGGGKTPGTRVVGGLGASGGGLACASTSETIIDSPLVIPSDESVAVSAVAAGSGLGGNPRRTATRHQRVAMERKGDVRS